MEIIIYTLTYASILLILCGFIMDIYKKRNDLYPLFVCQVGFIGGIIMTSIIIIYEWESASTMQNIASCLLICAQALACWLLFKLKKKRRDRLNKK